MSELVFEVFMRFLRAEHEGVTSHRCVEPRLRYVVPEVHRATWPGMGPLPPLFFRPTVVLLLSCRAMTDAIYSFGVFKMVAGSRFDAGCSLVAL